jgi:hypothetical protein
MDCCCQSMGDCSPEARLVDKKFLKDLSSRFKMKIKKNLSWCDLHRVHFLKHYKKCISCKSSKSGKLRPASRWLTFCHPLDKICRKCQDKNEIEVPAEKNESKIVEEQPKRPTKKQIAIIKKLMKKQFYLMPIRAEWCDKIQSYEKQWKYICMAINSDIVEKIILMRACTPDGDSKLVVGALVLEAWDPDAPKVLLFFALFCCRNIILYVVLSKYNSVRCRNKFVGSYNWI